MATRCNIILTDSVAGSKVYLYRHWDGYLAETGADLAAKLQAALASSYDRGFRKMLTALVCEKRGGDSHDKDRPQYEVTDNVHGDIEHLYEIAFNAGRANDNTSALVTHSMRRPGEDKFHGRASYSLGSFIALVNADRKATNKRIDQLKASSKCYADLEHYPMMEGAE